MSNQPAGPPRPALDLRGAVDLGALAARRPADAATAPGAAPAGAGAPAAGPPSAFVLCLTNDVIWWIPFALYLRDAPLPWKVT